MRRLCLNQVNLTANTGAKPMTINLTPFTRALQSIKDSVSSDQNKSLPHHTQGPYFHNNNGLISALPADPESEDYPFVADTASELGMESDQDKANAAFIVRACNSHYELLAALDHIERM